MMQDNKIQMEHYESSDESMKPKNSQSISQRDTTAKKHNLTKNRPQSEKKAPKQSSAGPQISIITYLDQLYQKQRRAEGKGKYKLANSCKSKIGHLKQHIFSRKLKQLQQQHKIDRKRIKEAHMNQIMRIEVVWITLSQSYNRKVEQMIQKWETKKNKQIRRLQNQLERLSHSEVKIRSKDLKQLQKAKEYFLRTQDYKQVKLIDKQIQSLAESLFQKVQQEVDNKMIRLQESLREKHLKEEAVLKDRIKRAKQEQTIHCHRQKKKLQKKYANVLKKLQRQQFLQIQQLQLQNKAPMQNPLNLSRRNAQWILQNSSNS